MSNVKQSQRKNLLKEFIYKMTKIQNCVGSICRHMPKKYVVEANNLMNISDDFGTAICKINIMMDIDNNKDEKCDEIVNLILDAIAKLEKLKNEILRLYWIRDKKAGVNKNNKYAKDRIVKYGSFRELTETHLPNEKIQLEKLYNHFKKKAGKNK